MAAQEKVTREAWEKLAPALGDDLRQIQCEVAQGVAQLITWGEGELFTVLRPEQGAHGPELVIVAAAGKNCVKWVNRIHQWAKHRGFYSVRLHTRRPAAMLRMGRTLGYQPAETILRAVL